MNSQLVDSLIQVIRSLSAEEQALLQQKLLAILPELSDRQATSSSTNSSEQLLWETLTAEQFLADYSPVDAIYDQP